MHSLNRTNVHKGLTEETPNQVQEQLVIVSLNRGGGTLFGSLFYTEIKWQRRYVSALPRITFPKRTLKVQECSLCVHGFPAKKVQIKDVLLARGTVLHTQVGSVTAIRICTFLSTSYVCLWECRLQRLQYKHGGSVKVFLGPSWASVYTQRYHVRVGWWLSQ